MGGLGRDDQPVKEVMEWRKGPERILTCSKPWIVE